MPSVIILLIFASYLEPSLMSHIVFTLFSAKVAQMKCTELFMLDLLHKTPHVERALVVSIDGPNIEVFISKYQLKGRVRLTDRRGLVRPPLRDGEDEEVRPPC